MMTSQDAQMILGSMQSMSTDKQCAALLEENALALQKSLVQAHEELHRTVTYLSEFGSLFHSMNKLKEFFNTLKKDPFSNAFDEKQSSVQELSGISDNELTEIYTVCYSLFQQQQFEKAASVAGLLSCLNPEISSFWRMQGLSYQKMNNNEAALSSFLYASSVNPADNHNHLAVLGCLVQLGQIETAKNYHQIAKETMEELGQRDSVRALDALIGTLPMK